MSLRLTVYYTEETIRARAPAGDHGGRVSGALPRMSAAAQIKRDASKREEMVRELALVLVSPAGSETKGLKQRSCFKGFTFSLLLDVCS